MCVWDCFNLHCNSSYEKILKFKTLRYPNNISVDNVSVDETYAAVHFEGLLDNTASSILELQKDCKKVFKRTIRE